MNLWKQTLASVLNTLLFVIKKRHDHWREKWNYYENESEERLNQK